MELKKYQKTVINDLTRFLALINEIDDSAKAYSALWTEKEVKVGFGGLQSYQDSLGGVPNVCFKVPTGGGKTFMAACSLKTVFDSLPFTKTKAVVWLVPSDAILDQTLRNLSYPQHPYREKIDVDFNHRVEVYSKNQLLNGQNFNPTSVCENLSIFVLSYDSFRTSKKEGRKAYQENGNLVAFSKFFNNPDLLLADTDETALIQVIRCLCPVVIVDESHHAATPLSKEMLLNFNPSFVLDLTATPRKDSNIISYVEALQLKRENMVKLPVVVYNLRSHDDVIATAISIREKLESDAITERESSGRYIRPIVLFQAEPRGKDTTTFDKLKKKLIEAGIPEAYIAIKTAERNDIKSVNLLSEGCSIRYIITINALKEGWDCPFAYVLATVANRSSPVDVEQILGRILRLPYTKTNSEKVLNISYAITSSNDFNTTLKKIVAGLHNAGFSENEYRIGSLKESPKQLPEVEEEQITIPAADNYGNEEIDINAEVNAVEIKKRIEQQNEGSDHGKQVAEMLEIARNTAEQFDNVTKPGDNQDYYEPPQEVRAYMNEFSVNEPYVEYINTVKLPQFVVPHDLPLFDENSTTLLTKEALTERFILRDKDLIIDFTNVEGEIAEVDVRESGGFLPKVWKPENAENKLYRDYFNSQPPAKRIEYCKRLILGRLSKNNAINDKDLEDYINRIVSGFSSEQLEDLQQSPHKYLLKIKTKIESLLEVHRVQTFDLWINQGKITCEPTYSFKPKISPLKYTTILPKTLYTAEEEMNGLEYDVANELSNRKNILWWHRNIAKSGFCINGYENAYPDIIAKTTSGKTLMIEPKGDHLENKESRQKVEIGTAWQNLAGGDYRYYMVFRNKDLGVNGAVRFDRFLEIVNGL
jgi:type III restriction enzyme